MILHVQMAGLFFIVLKIELFYPYGNLHVRRVSLWEKFQKFHL
jgi:hypothetical protein